MGINHNAVLGAFFKLVQNVRGFIAQINNYSNMRIERMLKLHFIHSQFLVKFFEGEATCTQFFLYRLHLILVHVDKTEVKLNTEHENEINLLCR